MQSTQALQAGRRARGGSRSKYVAARPLTFSPSGRLPLRSKKGSSYSIAERRVLELIPVLDSQPVGDVSHKPDGGCQYFLPNVQLPPQPLRELLPILLLGEQRHYGCEQFA